MVLLFFRVKLGEDVGTHVLGVDVIVSDEVELDTVLHEREIDSVSPRHVSYARVQSGVCDGD